MVILRGCLFLHNRFGATMVSNSAMQPGAFLAGDFTSQVRQPNAPAGLFNSHILLYRLWQETAIDNERFNHVFTHDIWCDLHSFV